MLKLLSTAMKFEILYFGLNKQAKKGMIAVQLPTLLCMHLLFLRNNSGNNGWPFGVAHFVYRR